MAHDPPDMESDGHRAPCLADAALCGVPGVLPSSLEVALDRSGITVSSRAHLPNSWAGDVSRVGSALAHQRSGGSERKSRTQLSSSKNYF